MKTTATIQQLRDALAIVNKNYDGNISFETLEQKTKNVVSFTLRAKSKLKGARVSHSGRNMPKASWHVHGELFDAIFELNPTAYIDSAGKRITIDGGNWQDMQIGSMMSPMYMSECSIF